jgi:hypothetical protein
VSPAVAVRALAGGALACRALAAGDGAARVLARPGGALYLTAGDTIVWLGPPTASLHPRAVLVPAVPDVGEAAEIRVDVAGLVPWRPPAPAPDAGRLPVVRETWERLDLASLDTPRGFGALLAGGTLAFPLDGAADTVRALGRACAGDDAAAAERAALALLGLGGGLTPSGDDFVGGVLFGRARLVPGGDARAWARATARLVAAAATRTHAISAALLADLATGCTHAPLHDLAAALVAGDAGRARAAAARVIRLGHSSGWDILAGLAASI